MPRITMTTRKLDSLKTDGKRVDYFDNRLPGFCVRVSGGSKSFAVFYRTGGRLRRLTLGTHPPLLLADARELAREALRSARLGSDPQPTRSRSERRKPLPIWLGSTSNCTQSNVRGPGARTTVSSRTN